LNSLRADESKGFENKYNRGTDGRVRNHDDLHSR
jgi:hypothetical protein